MLQHRSGGGSVLAANARSRDLEQLASTMPQRLCFRISQPRLGPHTLKLHVEHGIGMTCSGFEEIIFVRITKTSTVWRTINMNEELCSCSPTSNSRSLLTTRVAFSNCQREYDQSMHSTLHLSIVFAIAFGCRDYDEDSLKDVASQPHR